MSSIWKTRAKRRATLRSDNIHGHNCRDTLPHAYVHAHCPVRMGLSHLPPPFPHTQIWHMFTHTRPPRLKNCALRTNGYKSNSSTKYHEQRARVFTADGTTEDWRKRALYATNSSFAGLFIIFIVLTIS